MKCKNESCSNEVTGKAACCSPKCRKAASRSVTNCDAPSVTLPSVTSSVTCDYEMGIAGEFVYNRQAVRFQDDQYATRPEPLNITDKPHSGGRGKYTRNDGTVYQFDCMGTAFDVIDGKVYQSIDEVKACYI